MQVPMKYLQVHAGTHMETPAVGIRLSILLIQHMHYRLQRKKALSQSRSIGKRGEGNKKHTNTRSGVVDLTLTPEHHLWRLGPTRHRSLAHILLRKIQI